MWKYPIKLHTFFHLPTIPIFLISCLNNTFWESHAYVKDKYLHSTPQFTTLHVLIEIFLLLTKINRFGKGELLSSKHFWFPKKINLLSNAYFRSSISLLLFSSFFYFINLYIQIDCFHIIKEEIHHWLIFWDLWFSF